MKGLEELKHDLPEAQKIDIFINNLNSEIFTGIKSMYANPGLSSMIPNTFDKVLRLVREEYLHKTVTEPALVRRAETYHKKEESSLAAFERGGRGGRGGRQQGRGGRGAGRSNSNGKDGKGGGATTSTSNATASEDKKGCFICGASGEDFHMFKECPYYDPETTMDEWRAAVINFLTM